MSGRIFQNVVLQLKENTDRTVGVIDGEGIVIACSELAMIGQRWAEHVPVINAAGGAIVASDGKTFKALNGWGAQFDYKPASLLPFLPGQGRKAPLASACRKPIREQTERL